MGLLINYAYTGNVEISAKNAQGLLAAASLFQIPAVQKACADFMATQLEVSNCVGIYNVALLYGCSDLKLKSNEFINKNFTTVFHEDEFLVLTHEKVQEFLSSNDLNVAKEEEVFEALMRWVMHDERTRGEHLGSLLTNVRFGLLNSKYINNHITSNEVIMKYTECQKLLQNVKDFESNPETYQGEHNFYVILRSGMIKPEHCVLIIGGVNQNKPDINCYNPLTRETYFMADLKNCHRDYYYDVEDPACAVTDDNEVFVAGGNYLLHEMSSASEDSYEEYEEETKSKALYAYDNDHDCWMMRAPMLFPKSNFAMACVDGKIYCFGGLTIKRHPTEIIECYDVSRNRWNYVGMMPTPLVDLATVVVGEQIYVLGGRTGVGAHNVVMRYNPRGNEWTSLAGMPTPRFKFGACVVGDEIYVAGGQIYSHRSHTINRESLNSVEIYNIEQNQWRQGPELPEEMYNVGLFKIGSSLYAFGITEFQRSMYSVHRFNVVYKHELGRTDWVQLESDLCNLRDYACVAAKMHVRKLSQVFRPEVDT